MTRTKESWKARGVRHPTSDWMKLNPSGRVNLLLALSLVTGLQVIQHDIARPPMLITINAIPVLPRYAVLLVSEAHTGAVAVFMPLPIPATTLITLSNKSYVMTVGIAYRPAVMIAKSGARNCKNAPIIMTNVPMTMDRFRPIRFPIGPVANAPSKQPKS